MVRASYEQKPYRRIAIETWGGVGACRRRSTSPTTPARWARRSPTRCATASAAPTRHYALGSVLNHVLLHQTVIGLEAKEQLAMAGERLPDVVIAPCGGGSNLGGISFPFVPDDGGAAAGGRAARRARRSPRAASSTTSATPRA